MDVIDTHCCAIYERSTVRLACSFFCFFFFFLLSLSSYCSGKQTSNRLEAIDDCSTLDAHTRAGVHTPGHWLESSAAIIASWAADDEAAKFFFLFFLYSCFYLWSARFEWKNQFRLSCGHLTFPRPIDEHLLGIISFIFILFCHGFFSSRSFSLSLCQFSSSRMITYYFTIERSIVIADYTPLLYLRSKRKKNLNETIEGFFQMNDAWWSDVILFGIFLHDSMPMDRCTTNHSLRSIRRYSRSLWQPIDQYLRLWISKFRRENQFNYRTDRTRSLFESVSNESITYQSCQWKR